MNKHFLPVIFLLVLAACGGKQLPVATQAPYPTVTLAPSTAPTFTPKPQATPTLAGTDLQQIFYSQNSKAYIFDLADRSASLFNADIGSWQLSPDGSKIAYTFSLGTSVLGGDRIRIIDLETGLVAESHCLGCWFTWASNGDYLLVEEDHQTFVLDAADATPLGQIKLGYSRIVPLLSPLNEVFYFQDKTISVVPLFLDKNETVNSSLDGQRVITPALVDDTRRFEMIAISPHGDRIAFIVQYLLPPNVFTSGAYPNSEIYIIDEDGRNLLNLTQGRYRQDGMRIEDELSWSPDGSLLAFCRDTEAPNEDGTLSRQYSLILAQTDGAGGETLIDMPGWCNEMNWSPDGSQLMLVSDHQIFLIDPSTGEKTSLVILDEEGYIKAHFRPALATQTTPVNCAKRFTQLKIGAYARVAEGQANRVRSIPEKGNNVMCSIGTGTVIKIIAGPVCKDDLVFWQVEGETIPGGSGWTAEGDFTEHWLEAYSP